MVDFDAVWLDPADVAAWLGSPAVNDSMMARCAAAVEPQVERARPDMWVTIDPDPDEQYIPDAEVYQAAVMLAAREYVRRNSASGVTGFSDMAIYVARFDPEIERGLRVGAWRPGMVG